MNGYLFCVGIVIIPSILVMCISRIIERRDIEREKKRRCLQQKAMDYALRKGYFRDSIVILKEKEVEELIKPQNNSLYMEMIENG